MVVVKSFRNKNHDIRWVCKCDCGNIVITKSASLNGGKAKSCGCYAKDRTREMQILDLSGRVFGKLTVIELDESKRGHGAYWICRCECGNTCSVWRKHLIRRYTNSCGCGRESQVADGLKKRLESYGAIPEYKVVKNPKTGRWLPYDIYIPNGFFIEVHGIQHYEFVKHYHKTRDYFEYKQGLDKIKRRYAEENGWYIEVDLRKLRSVEDAYKYVVNCISG